MVYNCPQQNSLLMILYLMDTEIFQFGQRGSEKIEFKDLKDRMGGSQIKA